MDAPASTDLVLLATYGLRGPADGTMSGWIVVGAIVEAAIGKRWLNRTSVLLLGGVPSPGCPTTSRARGWGR